ncbi:O-antigen ligase family protein [Paramagnetospirillum magnetotacticum]|uniref:O-antigen ligase family protein n=1 Tax=Paramagnetospirillum magnetotacticum TaxID=188 RepID=UPI0000384AFB|nr:O-antigen ligase family protein [Paramagnetospirillum magnetotacticum]
MMAECWSALKGGTQGFMAFILFGIALAMIPLLAYVNRGTVVLLIIVAVAGLWSLLRSGTFSWPLGRGIAIAFMVFIVWGGLSRWWEVTPGLALPRAGQIAALIGAGIISLAAASHLNAAGRRWVAWGLTAAMVVFFAVILADLLSRGAVDDFVMRLRGQPPSKFHVMSHFKIGISIFGILLAPLLVWYWRQRNWAAVVLLPLALVGCGVVVGSNTGLVAFALAGLVLAVASWRRKPVAAILAVVLAAGFLVTPVVIANMPPLFELAAKTRFLPNSMFHRFAIWKFTSERIAERPVLGWGLDGSRELPGGNSYLKLPAWGGDVVMDVEGLALPLHPHNLFLQVWVEIGGVGALIMLAGALVLVMRLSRSARSGPAGLAMLAGALVVGASSFGAWQAWWLACQWLFAVYCVALTGDDEAKSPMRSNSAAA